MNIQNILVGISLWLLATIDTQGQAPVISRISPTQGTVNEMVTIRGRGFGTNAANVVVFFGGASTTIAQISDTELQVPVPAGATTASVSVVNLSTGLIGYSREIFTLSYDGFEFDRDKLEDPFTKETEENELYNFCVCDFNLDGYNDIVSTHRAPGAKATILQNNTTSINEVSFILSDVSIRRARWVRCGDINGDGKPDLIFTFSNESSTKNQVVVSKNMTDLGTPGRPISFEDISEATILTIDGEQGGRSVVRDVDGDGKPEVIVANLNNTGSVSIFRNKSTSSDISFDDEPILPFREAGVNAVGIAGIDVADLNNDGSPDLVASHGSGEILVFANESTPGNVKFALSATLTSKNIQNIKIGDMDGDKRPDIVMSGRNYSSVFRNTTDRDAISFASEIKTNPTPSQINTGIDYEGLDLADMDGNGRLDILITSEDNLKVLTVIPNYSSEGVINLGFDATRDRAFLDHQSNTVRGADFNGDGKPDLAYTDTDNNQMVIRINRNCIDPVLEPVNGLGICDRLPALLTATKAVGVTYVWESSADGNTFAPISGITTDSYETDDEQFYRVRVSSSNNGWVCPARTSNVVQIISPESGSGVPSEPTLISPNPPAYCFGATVTIEAQDAVADFVWLDPQREIIEGVSGNTLTIENITAAQAGAYSVYIQASEADGGCTSAEATTFIQVSEPPVVSIGADRPPVLLSSDASVTLSINPLANHTYVWKKDGSSVAGATTPSLVVTEAGSYTVVITNNNGCARESASFTVDTAQPTIPTEACLRQLVDFSITPSELNGTPIRYRWSFGAGIPQETATANYSYAQAGEFTVTVEVLKADGTVTDQREQTITVYDLPELNITTEGSLDLCPGTSVVLVGNEGFVSYAWSTGETDPALTVAEAGTYSLTVTSDQGCTITQDIEVRVVPNPEALITADSESIGLGESLQLAASGGSTYRWSPAATLSDSTIANPIASPLVTTTYRCVITTENGCSLTAEYTVYVNRSLDVDPRKIFSPNGDGQNETWVIDKMDLFPDCRLTLFDRQGIKIFEREDYSNNNPWDGTNNGQPVPAGVYFYLIDCGDEAGQQTGSVTIVR